MGLSTLFLGVYLFVALASQSFHHHTGSFPRYQEGHSSEKNISGHIFASENSGCLSCHFLHSGHAFIPETFSFELQKLEFNPAQIFTYADIEADFNHICRYLRGPPTDIV